MKHYLLWLSKILFPFFILVYALYPFLNGLGCKFSLLHDGEFSFQEGVCKGGLFNVYIRNKKDNSVVFMKSLWGSYNGYIYTYTINKETIKPPSYSSTNVDKLRYGFFYNSSNLISGYRFKINNTENTYLTFYDYPFEIIYISKINGKMGFL